MKRGYFEPTSLGDIKDRSEFSLNYNGTIVTGVVRNVIKKFPPAAFFLCHNVPIMSGGKPEDHDTFGFTYSWQVNNDELGWRKTMKIDGITDFKINYDSYGKVGYFAPKDFSDLKDGQLFDGNIDGTHTQGIIGIISGKIFLCQNIKQGWTIPGLDKKGFLYSWWLTDSISLSESMRTNRVNNLLVCNVDNEYDNEKALNEEETTTEIKLIGKNKLLTLNNY